MCVWTASGGRKIVTQQPVRTAARSIISLKGEIIFVKHSSRSWLRQHFPNQLYWVPFVDVILREDGLLLGLQAAIHSCPLQSTGVLCDVSATLTWQVSIAHKITSPRYKVQHFIRSCRCLLYLKKNALFSWCCRNVLHSYYGGVGIESQTGNLVK
jgi:hypothetical protein